MHPVESEASSPSRRLKWPIAATLLAMLQFAGLFAAELPKLQSKLAVDPDAIFRKFELWRLVAGPFVAGEFSWMAAGFGSAAILLFGWHLEIVQGRRRLLLVFFGGPFFAATLWSIAALIWNWHRPLFSPVAATSLSVAVLFPGLRQPFPAFLRWRIPIWIAFVAYAAAWQRTTYAGAIDLSAHFLAGLFAILVAQTEGAKRTRRTLTRASDVSSQSRRNDEVAAPSKFEPLDFDRRVDELLQKITESGRTTALPRTKSRCCLRQVSVIEIDLFRVN